MTKLELQDELLSTVKFLQFDGVTLGFSESTQTWQWFNEDTQIEGESISAIEAYAQAYSKEIQP